MPKLSLTAKFVHDACLTPPATEQDVYDLTQAGLVLRLRPTGKHVYRVLFARGKWFTLGATTRLDLAQARRLAKVKIGEVANGNDPQAAKRAAREAKKAARKIASSQRSLAVYSAEVYEPWLRTENPDGNAKRLCQELRSAFRTIKHLPIDQITATELKAWRTARLVAGNKPQTVSKNLYLLKTFFKRVVEEFGDLPVSPFAEFKVTYVEGPPPESWRNRHLSRDEETRFRAALTARDEHLPSSRRGPYADHVTPFFLLLLATGLRFGEMTALKWRDVDLARADLHVTALEMGARKAGKGHGRHVPLNSEAVAILTAWRPAPTFGGKLDDQYVFPGKDKKSRILDLSTIWGKLVTTATLIDFHIHDLRHTFASNLVMAGVDLNTVRELLGHASIKMTLRYAHLAPEHKAAAVAKLVRVV